jgi:hypothetical protein
VSKHELGSTQPVEPTKCVLYPQGLKLFVSNQTVEICSNTYHLRWEKTGAHEYIAIDSSPFYASTYGWGQFRICATDWHYYPIAKLSALGVTAAGAIDDQRVAVIFTDTNTATTLAWGHLPATPAGWSPRLSLANVEAVRVRWPAVGNHLGLQLPVGVHRTLDRTPKGFSPIRGTRPPLDR